MILIVDDDASVVTSLRLALKQAGYETCAASTPPEAMACLNRQEFDLVVQDMNFSRQTSGAEGLALLKQIKAHSPALPVILITAWGSVPLAVEGMKAGAADFITKPWTNEHLLQAIRTTLGLAALRKTPATQTRLARDTLDAMYDFRQIVGRAPVLLQVLDLIGRVAETDASVLITGESGTGKELVAEALHRNSPRRHQAFIKVNLGGISSTLFESEMFGHEKGAYTDAVQSRKGRFEVADRGTIFLDEIGDLDPSSQVKLLRVLQDRTYEVLGSSATRSLDVRVVSATNRPLAEMVQQGRFREDLLYRLNLISVHMPALRDRTEDIALLAQHFLYAASQVYRKYGLSIHLQAMQWLQAQPWPGNIRQLKHTIERAVLVSTGPELGLDAFTMQQGTLSKEPRTNELPGIGSMTLEEIERAMIEQALVHFGGNITRVAESLGLSRAALYRRFQKYGIEP